MDKRSLIQVKEYGDVYVNKKDHKIYRCGRGSNVGQLIEIKFQKTDTGYAYYDPSLGFVKRSRCLALALLKRPEGAKVVRHKDGDKYNDNIENLYWSIPVDPVERSKEFARKHKDDRVFLSFYDEKLGICRQYWCDRKRVKHLLDLKPRARGPFKEEYAITKKR